MDIDGIKSNKAIQLNNCITITKNSGIKPLHSWKKRSPRIEQTLFRGYSIECEPSTTKTLKNY